ncbi:MAG: DUF2203 domain-containing protein [Gemmatimonadaceae bacterium]|nr:DUF2203 domain-containing protein [Gemmatimonadaceae bacterium]
MDKVFTVDQANRTLPLVRRIVEDAVRDYYRWQDRVREFELASVRSTIDNPDPIALELEKDVLRLAESIDSYLDEVRQLGVEIKSIDRGIVAFPAEVGGRAVSLSWKLGDERVEYPQYIFQNG